MKFMFQPVLRNIIDQILRNTGSKTCFQPKFMKIIEKSTQKSRLRKIWPFISFLSAIFGSATKNYNIKNLLQRNHKKDKVSQEKNIPFSRCFCWIRNRSWREFIRQRRKMFLLISFTTSYSCYDGLLMFMYHFVTKFYLHLLPTLFFGSEMKLGPIWSILVIAEFLIHKNRDLGLI